MKNAEWVARTEEFVATTYGRFPIAMVRGEGCYLWDADEKRYLDLVAGLAVCNLGHAHPAVTEAIRAQAGTLLHVSNMYHIPQQTELAKLIVDHSFGSRVFFCNSGAEANEAALKTARKYGHERNGQYEILTTENSFHGRTYGALSATGQEKYRAGFAPHMPGVRYVPYGDIAAMAQAVSENTVAILIEPIQGEGGVNTAPAGYFKALRELCDERGILLILDEVQTGAGRTGTLWAYEYEGIEPDMMSLAKGLGGGMAIGALVLGDKVATTLTPGSHASTFGGNPLAAAAGLAAMKEMMRPDFLAHVRDVGEHLRARLEGLAEELPVIRRVRGRGLMLGVELHVPALPIVKQAMDRGVLLNTAGEKILRFIPPLVVTREQIDVGVDVVEALLREEVKHGKA